MNYCVRFNIIDEVCNVYMNTEANQRRIALREWLESDTPALFALAKDPVVGIMAGFPPHHDESESHRVICEVFSKPETYAIIAPEDGTLLGCINLFSGCKDKSVYDSTEINIGYWLGRQFWGQGFMMSAVELLCRRCRASGLFRCSKVVGCAKVDNTRSRKVLENAGFRLVEIKGDTCKYELALHGRKVEQE